VTIALLLIGDGRDDVHDRCWESAQVYLPPVFDHKVVVDDRNHKLGFGGAIRKGWSEVLDTGADFCFHLEADFTFNRDVPLIDMVDVLDQHPHLVQMALLRQPWNEQEREAGGILEMHPDDYEQCSDGPYRWVEHRRNFTTNPSLIPTWVLGAGWPKRAQSEGHFGIALFGADPDLRGGYWGQGEEWVEHIGIERVGVGY
jgi:hypothetical protein